MSRTWRERYNVVDALSADVHADLREATRDDAGAEHTRWSDLLDRQDGDKGYLVDLAQLFQQRSRRTSEPARGIRAFRVLCWLTRNADAFLGPAAPDSLQRLAEVQLSYTKDFTILHTLSSQPQIGCSVRLPGAAVRSCLPYRLSLYHTGRRRVSAHIGLVKARLCG